MFVFDDTMVLMAMMLKVVLNACSCLVYSPLGGKTDRIAGSPVYRGCKILDTTASHKLKPANKFDSNNRVWGVFTVPPNRQYQSENKLSQPTIENFLKK